MTTGQLGAMTSYYPPDTPVMVTGPDDRDEAITAPRLVALPASRIHYGPVTDDNPQFVVIQAGW